MAGTANAGGSGGAAAGTGGSSGTSAGTAGAGGFSGAAAGGTAGGAAGGTAGGAAGSGSVDTACYGYDSSAQTVTVIGREIIQFPLPRSMNVGETVMVHVTGKNQATTGFRSWLVDNMQVTSTNIVYFTGTNGSTVPPANFTLDYSLTVTVGTPSYLFFKAPTFGGIMENVTFTAITVTL